MFGILLGFIMGKVMEWFEILGGEFNFVGYFLFIDEMVCIVVWFSLDIIYFGCMYDVIDGLVVIILLVLEDESYVLVSFFDVWMNNFVVFNNCDFGGVVAEILLYGFVLDYIYIDLGYVDYDVSVLVLILIGFVLLWCVFLGGVIIEDVDEYCW